MFTFMFLSPLGERLGEGGTGVNDLLDLRPYPFRILNHLVRPKAHHAPTFALHRCGAARIRLDLKRMMIAVDLDHQPPRYAGKIRKIAADGMLSAKFRAIYAASTNEFPDFAFRTTAVATQFTCSIGIVVVSRHNPLT